MVRGTRQNDGVSYLKEINGKCCPMPPAHLTAPQQPFKRTQGATNSAVRLLKHAAAVEASDLVSTHKQAVHLPVFDKLGVGEHQKLVHGVVKPHGGLGRVLGKIAQLFDYEGSIHNDF